MSDEIKHTGWVREDVLKEQAEADAKAAKTESKKADKEKKQ
jgi:hypothetical protein